MRVLPNIDLPLPNQPITLAKERASLSISRETLEGDLTVLVSMLPRPRVVFDLELPAYFGLDISRTVELRFVSNGTTVPCQVLRGRPFSGEESVVRLRPLDDISRGALDGQVSKVVFGLPNFPKFIGHGVIRALPRGGVREDEIRLSFSNWNVVVRSAADIDERHALLSDNGGFGITAVGVLEKSDGQPFTWADAEPELNALRVFFSFACGRWTGPMLPAGVDQSGKSIWCRWSLPLLDDGFTVLTWFDTHQGASLSDLVPGFMTKWNDPLWRETFSYAIYWFVRANSAAAGADGSLILSQAALEILSWTYLVKQGGMSRSKFKSSNAGALILELLTKLSIPASFPSGFTTLMNFAGPNGDASTALAKIRNDLVHPEKRSHSIPAIEAWTLAQRMVELVILRLCGFNGVHANRTIAQRWVGQVEKVPWA